MPARRISQEERDIREGIRERYGEYLSPSEVGQLLGLNRTAMYEIIGGAIGAFFMAVFVGGKGQGE